MVFVVKQHKMEVMPGFRLCTSSACPRGRTPGNQGNILGNTRPRFFQVQRKGVGNSKFCKITDGNHGDHGDLLLSQNH